MNKLALAGTVDSELKFSHEIFGEKFYEFTLAVVRKSGKYDKLLCIIPEIVFAKADVEKGKDIAVTGEIRSHNYEGNDGKHHCKIFMFVKKVFPYEGWDENTVNLIGYICREPRYRDTPLGRQICDFTLAVERVIGKRDFVPCITWGRNAIKSSLFEVGDEVKITGRFQSREYTKRFDDGTSETMVAYEVSAGDVALVSQIEKDGENVG